MQPQTEVPKQTLPSFLNDVVKKDDFGVKYCG